MRPATAHPQQKAHGFTLIELLVVIAVLGVLAAGLIVIINPLGKLQSARDSGRKSAAKQIRDALARYSINGTYPSTSTAWVDSRGGSQWIPLLVNSGELKSVPVDPINTFPAGGPELIYYYNSNGTDYCLEINYERDVSTDSNYQGFWSQSYKLRYAPDGTKGAPLTSICQTL